MAKGFAIGMLILGAVIGAGFASGRELVSFFGLGTSPLAMAFMSGALIFGISVLFLMIGSRVNGKNVSEINVALAGKFHFVTDAFLLVNSLIILAGMLAAMDTLGATAIAPLSPLYAIIAGILCAVIATKGMKGLMTANKIVSPIMIIALGLVGILTIAFRSIGFRTIDFTFGNPWTVIVYVCMNMMLASTVVTTLGKMDKKTIFVGAGVAAVSIGALIFILLTALNVWGDPYVDMPVLDMARHIHVSVYWVMVAVIAVGIFTSMLTAMTGLVSWFEGLLGNKFYTAGIVLAAGFILSNLGFSTVVRVLYPVIGIMGVIYVALGAIFMVRTSSLKERLLSNRKRKANFGCNK